MIHLVNFFLQGTRVSFTIKINTNDITEILIKEEFEDTKGVIRIHK